MKKPSKIHLCKTILYLFIPLISLNLLRAQIPGNIDPTFNIVDQIPSQGVGFNGGVNTLVRLPDGKILTGGNHNTFNSYAALKIARINTDGSLDTTFFAGTDMDNDVYNLIVLPDGKILASGAFTRYAGKVRNRMMRLFSNGLLDTNFHPSFNNTVNHMLVQPDGKIIAVGNFTTVNGISKNRIIRLLPNGEIDTTFKIGIGFGGVNPNYIGLYKDTSILVGGSFSSYNGRSSFGLVHIFKDGSMDTSLNLGIGFNNAVNSCLPTKDNKIIAVGNFTSYNGKLVNGIVKLDSLGKIDSTFFIGSGFDSLINSMELLPNGDLIVMGYFNKYRDRAFPQIVKIKPDGSYDTTFNCGVGTEGRIHCFAFEPDGQLIIGGYMPNFNNSYKTHLVRVNPTNGKVDLQFNYQTGLSNYVYTLLQQPDGKILAGGYLQVFNNQRINGIVRLLPNGSRDETFNAELLDKSIVSCMALGSNGKIYAAGDLIQFYKWGISPVVRLNINGSIDTTYNLGKGFNNYINAIALLSNGKLWVAGAFTSFDGISRNSLARLNENGSLDSTINLGTGFNASLTDLQVQTDGKLLVAGSFTAYNGKACKGIARLNLDGTLDTTFNTGTSFSGGLYRIKLQNDGKIVCIGSFIRFNGVNKTSILRLNQNGSLDTTFNNGSNGAVFGSTIYAMDIQSDGKIIFAGNVTAYRGTQIKHLARVNSDGTLDPTFFVGAGANTTSMNSILIQSDERILIGGNFSTYNNFGKNRLARLIGGTLHILTQNPSKLSFCAGDTFSLPFTVYDSYNVNNTFTAELSDSSGSFSSPVVIGSINGTSNGTIPVSIPVTLSPGNNYKVRINSSSPAYIGSINANNLSINRAPILSIIGPDSVALNQQTISNFNINNALTSDSFIVSISPAIAGTWVQNGLTIAVTWNPSYNGLVELKVKGINSCGMGIEESKTTYVYSLTSISEIPNGKIIEIFPNPASDIIHVIVPNVTVSSVLEVLDLKGKIMKQIIASEKNTLDVSTLTKGMYFIRIGATVKKVLIY